jgi:Protein of unknown function (DUF2738).
MATKQTKVKRSAPCVVYVDEYDSKNIHFDLPEERKIPNSNMCYKSVPIGTKNPDGTVSDLYLKWKQPMFSFGVQELTSLETKKITGHSVSVCLYNKEGPTPEQEQGVQVLEEIIKAGKAFLLEHKAELGVAKLNESHLDKMDNMVYWETDKKAITPDGQKNPNFGSKVPGKGPTMSPKLIEFPEKKKGNEVIPASVGTVFYLASEVDANGKMVEVDPFKYLSTKTSKNYFHCSPLIKLESIYFGAVKTFQCKLTECDIFPLQVGQRRLLHNQVSCSSKVEMMTEPKEETPAVSEEAPVPVPEKKVVKKVVKKKVATQELTE